MLVVVIDGVDIDNGMNKAQDESLGGPVDDNVHGHVILVQRNFVDIRERGRSAAEAQLPTDTRKA